MGDELGNPNAVYLVAVEAGAVLGYGGMRSAAGEFYFDNIAVDPVYRRRGVGRKLVRAMADCAKEAGGLFVSLEVRASNLPAIELYRGLGFEEAGRRRGFYQKPAEDGLIFTKWFEENDK